jgi:hypothetical protein
MALRERLPILAYRNLTSNGTTVIKSGKGILGVVTLNRAGASSNTLTLYDNTAGSGDKIATIDTTAGIGSLAYDVPFNNGLTAVLATGSAPDVTIMYA